MNGLGKNIINSFCFRARRVNISAIEMLNGRDDKNQMCRNYFFGPLVIAAVGSFAVAGNDAATIYNRSMSAGAGSFTVTGIDAGLRQNRSVSAVTGSYSTAISASAYRVVPIVAGAGSFVLTGNNTGFRINKSIAPEVTSFQATVQYAGVLKSRNVKRVRVKRKYWL